MCVGVLAACTHGGQRLRSSVSLCHVPSYFFETGVCGFSEAHQSALADLLVSVAIPELRLQVFLAFLVWESKGQTQAFVTVQQALHSLYFHYYRKSQENVDFEILISLLK